MITNRNRIWKAATVLAMMMFPLAQSYAAHGGNNQEVEITFEKWLLAPPPTVPPTIPPPLGPLMAGFVGGDVPGLFEGTVLQNAKTTDGLINRIEARYTVIANNPRHSFSALIHGTSKAGIGDLKGVITDGWRAGSQVHVEFKAGPCAQGTCFVGTIRILRDKDND